MLPLASYPPTGFCPWVLNLVGKLDSKNIDQNCRDLTNIFNKMSVTDRKGITEVLSEDSYISDREIKILAGNCPDISKLRLENSKRIGDTAVKTIADRFSATLTELCLRFSKNTADSPLGSSMGCLPLPATIKDPNFEVISDESIEVLLTKCKKLERLDLSGTCITGNTLERIASINTLRELHIFGSYIDKDPKKRTQLIDRLITQRPDLKILDDRGYHEATERPHPDPFIHRCQSVWKAVKSRFECIGNLFSRCLGFLKMKKA